MSASPRAAARLAVERGITETAGVVTSAAAVMVSVFAVFATLTMLEMKQMGVGLAAAILRRRHAGAGGDAARRSLVLLGERAWWPGRPNRPRGERVVETDPAYELAGR